MLDTNVFVAAGFNPGSHSAWLVEAVRDGRLRMIWDHHIGPLLLDYFSQRPERLAAYEFERFYPSSKTRTRA